MYRGSSDNLRIPLLTLPRSCAMQADSSAPVTIRTRKFITNRLLARRQFVVDILHPSRANVSKSELQEKIAAIYKTTKERVVTFGLRTQFGGGRTTGFALIYDDEASQRKFEPKYRLIRVRRTIAFWFPQDVDYASTSSLVSWRPHQRPTASSARSARTVPRRCALSSSLFTSAISPVSQLRGTKKSKASEAPKKGK